MSGTLTIDGMEVSFEDGQTIMEAATAAGIYIAHLCHHPDFTPHGSCKLCTVKVNGLTCSACTFPAADGQDVLNETGELNDTRKRITQMLFVEGNHFCPSCEKSGNCQLQAVGYHLNMLDSHFPHFYDSSNLDATHPDIVIDHDRCIFCSLCVRASSEHDGKEVFAISGRGINKHLIVNAKSGKLADTDIDVHDRAADICPTGAILIRGTAYKIPIGQRVYDNKEIDEVSLESVKAADGSKIKLATTSLAGCFGCHMSLLDIDERILELVKVVEFNRSPLTDIKQCSNADIGLIEGGVCNAENVHVLREFRDNCKILVGVGACALNGGLPAMRNHIPVQECLQEAYLDGIGVENPQIPNDPELPLLLNQVYPIHEVVKVDYFLPGCPPSADVFWKFLTDLIAGQEPSLTYDLVHYD